ncbi:class I SAM-dependent methyltransferase [Candidatus Altiarchaeota archaeon]
MVDESGAGVSRSHYFEGYDDVLRFISYYYQIDLVRSLGPGSVLEVGVGNKTVANYLLQNGFDVTTCDVDGGLRPDFVGDVRDLPFDDGTYDTVLCSQVLEHLPWEEVDKALAELQRVARKHVVVSIPYSSLRFQFLFRFPYINKIFNRQYFNLFYRIPYLIKGRFSPDHPWEMGRKGYPGRKIRSLLEKYFKIIREVTPVLTHHHLFFVLEKK